LQHPKLRLGRFETPSITQNNYINYPFGWVGLTPGKALFKNPSLVFQHMAGLGCFACSQDTRRTATTFGPIIDAGHQPTCAGN
jgi:hypothetical protein